MTNFPKRILLLGLNSSPELIGIGKYTGELVDDLVAAGVDLRVVTTPPYYPEWRVKTGYSGWAYRREVSGKKVVYRCPLWVPKKVTNLSRVPHLLSFSLSSLPVMLAQTGWKPDLVICVIPTLFSAPIAWLVARLTGAKCWLHIQDFELDAASNLGMLPGGARLLALARVFEHLIISRFDRVSAISEKMLARAVQRGVPQAKTFLFPNWVDTEQIFPLQGTNLLRAELGIAADQKVILYHGNLGRKQGLDLLLNAARRLQDRSELLFLICGEGVERAELEHKARDLPNVRFINLLPVEKLNQLVNLADLHVLPQRAGAADTVMPSKLTTMLASGRPVLACAAPGTQLWKLVNQVGRVVPPEEAAALAEAICELLGNPLELQRLGKLGREFACQFLGKETLLAEFKREVEVLTAPSQEHSVRIYQELKTRG
jgi:colanic acid biosynthesis glycosyl transferase WcaI